MGHIAFSPVTISDVSPRWYGIGPFSVLPEYQRRNIGSALVAEGLSKVKTLDGKGCILVGDPGIYHRLGFRNISGLVREGIPQEVFVALPFGEALPSGTVAFQAGFAALG